MSSESTTETGWPSRWTLARDVISFVAGWVLTFMEVYRPEVRESVLLFAGSLIVVPGASAGITSASRAIRNGTGGSHSEPQPPVSSSSSS